jgi:UDP-N-acetylglucosamine--N-acetylmuramyl-(pentapeptide) pyrophosphoryl-undecaprenol N-acetylglucosamine transferase
MNLAMAQMFKMEQDMGFPFRHIHAVGSYGWEWMPEHVRKLGVDPETTESIDMRQYIYNMPEVMTAADVFISRAGSGSCNEIAAAGIPCILIPSPNVTDNHQEKNARALEAQGGAVVVLEKDCTAQRLMDEVKALLADTDRRRKMSAALQNMVILDSAERICGVMEELAATRRQRR